MIYVMCRLIEERKRVLRVLQTMGAVWGRTSVRERLMVKNPGVQVQPLDFTYVNASGRIYYGIDDEQSPVRVYRIDHAPTAPVLNADEFVKVHTKIMPAKVVKKTAIEETPVVESVIPTVYPFELVGDPIELEKGSDKWYRQISTMKDVIVGGHVETSWRGANSTFPLMAILKGREKPFIGYPHGATPGPLFVRVPAPKKVMRMTKKQLEELVAEKFGDNVVLDIKD